MYLNTEVYNHILSAFEKVLFIYFFLKNNIYPLNSSKSSEEDLLSISTKNKGSQTQESPLKNTNSGKTTAVNCKFK